MRVEGGAMRPGSEGGGRGREARQAWSEGQSLPSLG